MVIIKNSGGFLGRSRAWYFLKIKGSVYGRWRIKFSKDVFRSLALVSQAGFAVITPILILTLIGVKVDGYFGTHFFIPLLILGVVSGMVSMFKTLMGAVHASVREEREGIPEKSTPRKEAFKKPKPKSRVFGKDTV